MPRTNAIDPAFEEIFDNNSRVMELVNRKVSSMLLTDNN
jgi:hypothetical protein